jgi:hypothetical protein
MFGPIYSNQRSVMIKRQQAKGKRIVAAIANNQRTAGW